MCEFDVIMDGNVVFKDVIYAKAEKGKVVARDILGELKEYKDCRIEMVDVDTNRLVLSSI